MFSPYSNPCSTPMQGSEHCTLPPSVFTRIAPSRANASRFYRAIVLQDPKHCTPSRRNVLRSKVSVSGSIAGNQSTISGNIFEQAAVCTHATPIVLNAVNNDTRYISVVLVCVRRRYSIAGPSPLASTEPLSVGLKFWKFWTDTYTHTYTHTPNRGLRDQLFK